MSTNIMDVHDTSDITLTSNMYLPNSVRQEPDDDDDIYMNKLQPKDVKKSYSIWTSQKDIYIHIHTNDKYMMIN
jgi:hypothetical protein